MEAIDALSHNNSPNSKEKVDNNDTHMHQVNEVQRHIYLLFYCPN